MTENTVKNVHTPEGRVSYPNVFTARENQMSGKMEYDCTLIFKKDADLSKLKAAAAEALTAKFGPNQKAWPDNLRQPFRKCREKWKKDKETGADIIPQGMEDPDAVWIQFRSNVQPSVVDAQVQKIMEQKEFYGGCWAVVSARPYAYDKAGNRGVSFGLGNIQKTRDDEAFGGGRIDPEDEFQSVGGAAASSGGGAASIFD